MRGTQNGQGRHGRCFPLVGLIFVWAPLSRPLPYPFYHIPNVTPVITTPPSEKAKLQADPTQKTPRVSKSFIRSPPTPCTGNPKCPPQPPIPISPETQIHGKRNPLELGRDKVLRVLPLLLSSLRERGDARDDTARHEGQRNDGPDDAPALGRPSIPLGKDAGVGAVDFAQDEIVALFHLQSATITAKSLQRTRKKREREKKKKLTISQTL